MPRAALLGLEVGLLILFLGGSAGAAGAAEPGHAWAVWVDGRPYGSPVLLEAGGEVWLDPVALAPDLDLDLTLDGDRVRLQTPGGRAWRGRLGGTGLTSGDHRMAVRWAQTAEGTWYLPAGTLAALSGRDLRLDPDRASVELLARPAPATAAADVPETRTKPEPDTEGWESFTLAKTGEEMRESERLAELGPTGRGAAPPPELPPERDRLAVRLGLGYVAGGDWGFETTAVGGVAGVETRLATLLTYGPEGGDFYSGRLDLDDPARGWGAQAGDLFSETWGFARGLRVSWRQGRREPALALYLPSSRSFYDQPLIAYRDEIALGERGAVGGEVASDGAWFLRGRFRHRRLALYGYLRDTPHPAGDGHGATLAWELPLGLTFQGSVNRLGEGAAASDWGTASLRVALPGGADATLEATEIDSPWGTSRAQALILALPAGPVRLRARYQQRENEFSSTVGPSHVSRHRELQGGVGYGSRRFRVDVQGAVLWLEQGDPISRGQLVASYELGRSTSFQVLSTFADRSELGRYRLRLSQLLPHGFEVAAEYGDVPPYQSSRRHGVRWSEEEHLKLMVRRSFDASTPGSGGRLEGRTLGPAGERLEGVAVRLGPYRTYSDASGRFVFANVPAGSYELAVDEQGTPSHLAPLGLPTTVELGRTSRLSSDLFLAPLGSVSGQVFLDRDRDGRRGPGEGVAGVVVVLGEDATATATDGSFAFHNVPAGTHRLRLVADRLPRGIRTGGPATLEVGLPAGRSSTGLELRLVEVRRPVVFQEASP